MATLSSAAARTLTTAPTIGPSLPCSTPNTDRRYADGGCAMTFRMCGVRTLSAASPVAPGTADCAPGSIQEAFTPRQRQELEQQCRNFPVRGVQPAVTVGRGVQDLWIAIS